MSGPAVAGAGSRHRQYRGRRGRRRSTSSSTCRLRPVRASSSPPRQRRRSTAASHPDAVIDVKLKVGAGGSLAWLPQETILFDRARLSRAVDIELADEARLVFGEAVIFGRSGMGEIVRHGRLEDRWRLRRHGRIIHAEAMRLEGDIAARLAQSAVGKGAVAVATVLILPGDEMTAAGVRALGDRFRGDVAASAWKGMMVVRLCAADGAASSTRSHRGLEHDARHLAAAALAELTCRACHESHSA